MVLALACCRKHRERSWASGVFTLYAEKEIHHVAILDHVILAFPHFSCPLPWLRIRPAGDEVVVGDGLGTDETRSKSVWITPAAWGGIAPVDGPRAHFLTPAVK